mgnify:CR=1 FL=1
MEGKSLKDVYNRLIDLYGFYEINKDSDEYKIALRFMSQEDLLKDDIDNIRLLVKDDGGRLYVFLSLMRIQTILAAALVVKK